MSRIETKVDVHIAIALPKGRNGIAIETPGEFICNVGVGESQPIRDLLVQVDAGQHLVFMPIGMDVDRARRVIEDVLDLVADGTDRAQVVAHDAHLDGSLHGIALLQFLDKHLGFRSNGWRLLAELVHQLWRSFDGVRVDQDLREIGCRRNRVDVVIEAGEARAQEAGIAANFGVLLQIALDTPHRRVCSFDARSFGQPDIHDKLVAFRQWEELLANKSENSDARDKTDDRRDQDLLLVVHRPGNDAVVIALHVVQGRGLLLGLLYTVIVQPLLDEKTVDHRGQHHGDHERNAQRNRDGDRQSADELSGRTGQQR